MHILVYYTIQYLSMSILSTLIDRSVRRRTGNPEVVGSNPALGDYTSIIRLYFDYVTERLQCDFECYGIGRIYVLNITQGG